MNFCVKSFFLMVVSLLIFTAHSTVLAAPNYGEALQKAIFFYDIQRFGRLSSATGLLANRLYWRSDAFLQDYALPNQEGPIDLGGGFADAGDNVKFNFPMAASTTMLAWAVIEFRSAFEQSGQLTPMLANLHWATDYLLKCWDSKNQRLFGQVSPDSVQAEHSNLWMPYEVLDQASADKGLPRFGFYVNAAHPGTDLAGETVAAFACASMAFSATDPAYATQLANAAKSLYDAMVNVPNKGKYSDNLGRLVDGSWKGADVSAFYNSWSGYADEVAWSSMWMYRLSGNTSYLTIAKQFVPFGNTAATQSWDDKSYGTYILMAKFLPNDDAAKATAQSSAIGYLDSWSQGTNGHAFSQGGLAIASALTPWGNARYAASTAFMALIYDSYFATTKYDAFAKGQIDYLLGSNSKGFSYTAGISTQYPRRIHHATAEGRWDGNNDVGLNIDNRHIAYGALVGGPKDLNDSYQDDRNDYIGNEVALDYNAGFVGALAALYSKFGGTPLPASQFPPTALSENPPKDEVFVNGTVQSAQMGSNQSTIQVSLLATNHSAWPARVTRNLKIRYFVNLADKPSTGTVTVRNFSTDPRAVISNLTLFDAGKQIYYVEVWFKDIPIYPGGDERSISSKETQLQFTFNWAHDYTKDWSYQGLGLQGAYNTAPNIPIYDIVNGSDHLLFGSPPANIPQGTLTLKFNPLPSQCVGAQDVLNVGGDKPSFTIGNTPFTHTMAAGGPYAASLASTTNPIIVSNGSGTCSGMLDAQSTMVPGTLTATYTFTKTPPPIVGTIKVVPSNTSDAKCSGASDTFFIDQETVGQPFVVSATGVSRLINVGTHSVHLQSGNSIPAPNNLPGVCVSSLDKSTVTVTMAQTSLINATYTFKPNSTGMSCSATGTITQQSDWGSPIGIVNTFAISVTLNGFPKSSDGSTALDGSFSLKNNFVQNFWGNFNISASTVNQNNATFKGTIWSNDFTLGGFIFNKNPMKLGDNPITSMSLNGVACAVK